MKLITLNTWSARTGLDEFLDFFKKNQSTVDVFCLQEATKGRPDQEAEIKAEFNDEKTVIDLITPLQDIIGETHTAYWRPNFKDWYGLAIFARKSLVIQKEGDVLVHEPKPNDLSQQPRNIQYLTLSTPNGERTIINFHGLWTGGGKEDTDSRIQQSNRIIEFIKTIQHPIILCGDFNLLPDTKSLKMFEELGLKNLVKEFGITSTRTKFYTKPTKFADYIFTSPEINIQKFEVLPDEISDHSPLLVECE